MSSRRTVFAVLASAALAVLSLQRPAAAAETPMLRLVDSSSLQVPAELAASPAVAPVRLNLAALEDLEGRRLDLPLPDGRVLKIERTDVERRGRRDYAWRGRTVNAKGEVDGYVTLTVLKDRVIGRIVTPGKIWKIVPDKGRHWLAQAVKQELPCGTDGQSEVASLVRKKAASEMGGTAANPDPTTHLRLVVVYPHNSARGNASLLIQEIRAAVDDANTAMANSGINARIELVRTAEVNHAESRDPIEDLIFLYDDPAMVALRRQANAPLISIVTLVSPGICGVGNLMDRDEFEGRIPPVGVSLVRRSCLDDQTLMHELGHNLGAHHDPVNGPPPNEALVPYSYGHFSPDGNFVTVMSYTSECPGCVRVDHISNPNVSFAGFPTGIPGERDNARLLEETRSRYGYTVNTPPPGVPGPPCGPGVDRLCLLRKRFKVELAWQNQFNGTSGTGRSLARTDAAGFFSFGDPSNLELMVKLLDFGNVVKVFWGQLTNLRYQLTITDTKTGQVKLYENTPGECGGIDQGAFPGSSALGAAAAANLAGPISFAGAASRAAAGCRTSTRDLLCLDSRFTVSVDWRNPGNGTRGTGVAVPFSKLTGAFHFGDPSNLELMAKVINQGDRIDFFWGALSDLEYTLHVTDTLTRQVKTYQNAGGHYCGGLEVDAF